MATKKPQATKGDSLEAKGPAQDGQNGFDPTSNPVNPSDRIFLGSPLPMISAQVQGMRRPFREPVRPPLHYSDGGGPDEAVTSRRPPTQAALGGIHLEVDHKESRPIQGEDANKYANGPDDGYTTNGVEIRGT